MPDLTPEEHQIKRVFEGFGWQWSDTLTRRYLTDAWFCNLTNALVALADEIERLRKERDRYRAALEADGA